MRNSKRNDLGFRQKFHTRLRARSRTKFHTRLHAKLKMKGFGLSARPFHTRLMRKNFHTRSAPNLTQEMHNGSVTFLYLAVSHVFRIYHKNCFERNKHTHLETSCSKEKVQTFFDSELTSPDYSVRVTVKVLGTNFLRQL